MGIEKIHIANCQIIKSIESLPVSVMCPLANIAAKKTNPTDEDNSELNRKLFFLVKKYSSPPHQKKNREVIALR